MNMICSTIVFTFAVCTSMGASADDNNGRANSSASVQTKVMPFSLQPWQQRRMEFSKLVQGVHEGNPTAIKDFDTVLTEFDTKLFSRTPMENMEILGLFYVPKDGADVAFPIVVANSVLGWYDALRYTSESGRAEIFNNEGFFKKAFVLGGPDVTSKAIKFVESNPERAAQQMELGFSFAQKFRDTLSYDHQWPTAYGLERIICAQGGSCVMPPILPKEGWDKAFEEAKQRVALYYHLGKPATTN